MRKWLPPLVIMFFFMIITPSFAAEITLDGKKISPGNNPVTENGRTLVPLRAISEALGCEVSYDGDTRTVRLFRNGTYLRLNLDSEKAYINEKIQLLDVPARSVNGVTMVPVRFVSETLGLDVRYENGNIALATKDYAKIHFIDVGDGDAIYISLPNNQDILIDAGGRKAYDKVLHYLKENNVDDIELLISTHPHEGQMGGIPFVLKKYKVDRIIESGMAEATETYYNYRDEVQKGKIKTEVADKQKIKLNGATLDVLTSYKENSNRDIDGKSVASLLTVGETKFLFMADVVNVYDMNLPEVEVVKIASLRGGGSTRLDLLEKVKPETVIISVSKDNAARFPDEETLIQIKETGAGVVRTSLNGDIVIATNGKTFSISTNKNEAPEYKKRAEPPVNYGLYVGDKNGDLFHWPGCRRTDDIKIDNKIWFRDANHAKDNGYQACQFCGPQ